MDGEATGIYLKNENDKNEYLTCEKRWIFLLLMSVAGFFGGFTYSIRGKVFCNAQTGNFVFLSAALGNKDWNKAFYYFVPMITYIIGTIISELAGNWVRKWKLFRWDTILIIIEILFVFGLGFVPETAPNRISHIVVTFLCSMQYNTFRQAQGVSMSTTICTNHFSQFGSALAKVIRHRNNKYLDSMTSHLYMLLSFFTGAVSATILGNIFLGKAIWFTLIPLAIVLYNFLIADLKKEKNYFHRIPMGH